MVEMKNVIRRFVALCLVIALFTTLLPHVQLAAYASASGELPNLENIGIGLKYEGDAEVAWTATEKMIIGSAQSKAGSGCGSSGTNYQSNLVITNNKTTAAQLSFKYSIT